MTNIDTETKYVFVSRRNMARDNGTTTRIEMMQNDVGNWWQRLIILGTYGKMLETPEVGPWTRARKPPTRAYKAERAA